MAPVFPGDELLVEYVVKQSIEEKSNAAPNADLDTAKKPTTSISFTAFKNHQKTCQAQLTFSTEARPL
jgi:hypothetical protein